MPSDGVAQTDDQPKDETLYGYCTEGQKTLANVLAEAIYDCSIGGFLRHILEEDAYDKLDEDTVEVILSGDVSEDEALALVNDEISVAELSDTKASAVADGGSATKPSNYNAQLTSAEVARSGRELTWDELRNIVSDPEDGGLWADDLQIHPDRVPEDVFKRRQKPVSRVLTAIARSKAEVMGDVLPSEQLNELIDTYCLHLTNRADEERGKSHIRRTYRRLVEEYLWSDPNPAVDRYYTTRERLLDSIEITIQEDLNNALLDDVPAIFNERSWSTALDREVETTEWHEHLAETLEYAATAKTIADEVEHDEVEDLEFDRLDGAKDGSHHLTLLWTQFTEEYQVEVPMKHKKDVQRQFAADKAVEELNL